MQDNTGQDDTRKDATRHVPGKATRYPAGLSELHADHDLVLCDIWGVLHNGVANFTPAAAALAQFRRSGGRVILVSNAPRPHGSIAAQLKMLGVTGSAYDAILTSGDVTQGLIRLRQGQRLLHIGPERDHSLFDGLDAPRGTIEDSQYVVCTGLVDDETETAADYAGQLAAMAARRLPMICANPDLVVDRGGRNVPCAGSIGVAYERIGGAVTYPGKPHAPIYDAALEMAEGLTGARIAKSRVLAIGDSIRTDIAGASAYGVASLMVLNGIHAHETATLGDDALDRWLAAQEHVPDFAMRDLR